MKTLESHDAARDLAAAILSIIPGLGHFYKGLWMPGIYFLALTPLAIYCGLLLGLATFGVGLLFPICYVLFVMVSAFTADDHSKHRMAHAWFNLTHRRH